MSFLFGIVIAVAAIVAPMDGAAPAAVGVAFVAFEADYAALRIPDFYLIYVLIVPDSSLGSSSFEVVFLSFLNNTISFACSSFESFKYSWNALCLFSILNRLIGELIQYFEVFLEN